MVQGVAVTTAPSSDGHGGDGHGGGLQEILCLLLK
jgi:hypothetical protein